ncbi:MAG: hypothetical protein QOI94_2965, partial [Acidobacteriaceae bacterium]|nr:hypothetical protein [Acidobacteriaceae bacterium]
FERIIGNSAALESVLEQVEQVAPTDSTVLIEGDNRYGIAALAGHAVLALCPVWVCTVAMSKMDELVRFASAGRSAFDCATIEQDLDDQRASTPAWKPITLPLLRDTTDSFAMLFFLLIFLSARSRGIADVKSG